MIFQIYPSTKEQQAGKMSKPSPFGFSLTGKALSYLPVLTVINSYRIKKKKNN